MPLENKPPVGMGEVGGEGKEVPMEHILGVDGEDELFAAAQYPCTADDHFEVRLIDAVEKNPCIFNRCHPLHKMSDYKSHVWNQVALQLSFTGPGVELERKWRHMRDRYVRLRKLDRTSAPLKKGDKWYYYYKKMSFLDPYIEHRNRRKRGDLIASIMKLGNDGIAENKYCDRNDDEGSDSGDGEAEDRDRDPLKEFYASFSNNAGMPPLEPEPTCDSLSVSGGSGASKKRKADEPVEDDVGDTEVSLFVRSIEKTLSSMDARTFALARLEISRVLFDCQFGERRKD